MIQKIDVNEIYIYILPVTIGLEFPTCITSYYVSLNNLYTMWDQAQNYGIVLDKSDLHYRVLEVSAKRNSKSIVTPKSYPKCNC